MCLAHYLKPGHLVGDFVLLPGLYILIPGHEIDGILQMPGLYTVHSIVSISHCTDFTLVGDISSLPGLYLLHKYQATAKHNLHYSQILSHDMSQFHHCVFMFTWPFSIRPLEQRSGFSVRAFFENQEGNYLSLSFIIIIS